MVKVLSAKYGLIDGTDIIEPYDQRLTPKEAARKHAAVLRRLGRLGSPASVFVNLGKDYRPAVEGIEQVLPRSRITWADGGIGSKMKAMKRWLRSLPVGAPLLPGRRLGIRPYLYFFPDWDDYVYEPFTANETDELRRSAALRRTYAHEVFGRRTPYDGVLVSLAQLNTSKGALGRNANAEGPTFSLRRELHLPRRLILFGDCGAFSYVGEPQPPLTPAEAAELYDRFGFELGASVDHIPVPEIATRDTSGQKIRKALSKSTQYRRLRLTVDNAQRFLAVCTENAYSFVPIGVIQGIGVSSYVRCIHDYIDMGYRHIALGGLVPRPDSEIMRILCAVRRAIQEHGRRDTDGLWLHLFGILRPRLQPTFRTLGVTSFDSASYLRKAWLRSDQNYLAPDGNRWYSTIRIPIAHSKRMRKAATSNGISQSDLAQREQRCLAAVGSFDGSEGSVLELLDSVDDYGPLLDRRAEDNHFAEKHLALVTARPWLRCPCPICRRTGINVVVFRGANRNKRRGLHNTWVLYHRILHGKSVPVSGGNRLD